MFKCPYMEKCKKHLEEKFNQENCSEKCIIYLHYKTDETGTEGVKEFANSKFFKEMNQKIQEDNYTQIAEACKKFNEDFDREYFDKP
ncbi:MAG: hypothetical protein E7311_01225 [Clostridiales bacterium]|nr:hypothetical protein [Clostridiales bacterium]